MLRWTPWIVRALLFGFFHRQHLISSRLASNLSISSNDVRNMNCLQVQSVPLVYLTAIFQYPSSQWTRHSLLRDWTSEHLPMRDRHESNWPHQFRWTFVSGFFANHDLFFFSLDFAEIDDWRARTSTWIEIDDIFPVPHPYFEKKRDCPMNGMIVLNYHCYTYHPTEGRIVHVICGRGPFNGLRKRGVMIGTCRIVQVLRDGC